MSEKTFISANEFLHDCWRLARQVLDDAAWRPDVILALWRGGAPVGVAVHEFLLAHGRTPTHVCVRCSSYSGIGQAPGKVVFDITAEAFFNTVSKGQRILVLDDVFDTGRTAEAVLGRLDGVGADARIGCVYWKPVANRTQLTPDYFARKLNEWIVFPHELDGLSPEEIRQKDPALAELW